MKTQKELNITYRGDFYGFENTPFSKTCCDTAINNCTTPSEIERIRTYQNSLYQESDADDIQRAINYTVTRFLKMDKTFNNALDSLKRWKYVYNLMQSYKKEFPDKTFNTKSFYRLKDDIVNELFK